MKQQIKCTECGNPFFVAMIKVWVFKERYCSKDKTVLNVSRDNNTFTCPKCQSVFKKDNSIEFASLGVRVMGSTRDFIKANEQRDTGKVEVELMFIPEQQMDQKCRNLQNRYAQATQNRERKIAQGVPDDIRVIPDTVTDAQLYRYEIYKKTQEDYREAQNKKSIAEREAEMKRKIEEEKKAKLIEKVSQELQKKKQLQPQLIDPETRKLINQAKRRDKWLNIARKQVKKNGQ